MHDFLLALSILWLFLLGIWDVVLDGLLLRFRRRMPEIAAREIPFVFEDDEKHSEKTWYFYRKKAIYALKQDPQLWRQRQQIMGMTVFIIAIPIFGLACWLGRHFDLY